MKNERDSNAIHKSNVNTLLKQVILVYTYLTHTHINPFGHIRHRERIEG
jgi:hypothetical protein